MFCCGGDRLTVVTLGYTSVGKDQWKCIACDDGRIRDGRAVARHNATAVHIEARAHRVQSRSQPVTPGMNYGAGSRNPIAPGEDEASCRGSPMEIHESLSEVDSDDSEAGDGLIVRPQLLPCSWILREVSRSVRKTRAATNTVYNLVGRVAFLLR